MKKYPNTAANTAAKLDSRRNAGLPTSDAQRRQELARLLPIWPNEAADLSLPGRRHITRLLERALRAERRRGRAGHWAYDISRHAALIALWKSEAAALHALQLSEPHKPKKKPACERASIANQN